MAILDEKYDNMSRTLGEQMKQIVQTQNHFESELEVYEEDVKAVNVSLAQKLNVKDG